MGIRLKSWSKPSGALRRFQTRWKEILSSGTSWRLQLLRSMRRLNRRSLCKSNSQTRFRVNTAIRNKTSHSRKLIASQAWKDCSWRQRQTEFQRFTKWSSIGMRTTSRSWNKHKKKLPKPATNRTQIYPRPNWRSRKKHPSKPGKTLMHPETVCNYIMQYNICRTPW